MSDIVSSVVITTYNDTDRLRLTLAGLARQETHKLFEVIIVSDGETHQQFADTCQLVVDANRYTNTSPLFLVQWLGPATPDFRLAKARNLGLSRAQGAQVIICDCDTVPNSSFVAQHQRSLDTVNVGLRKRISIQNSEQLFGRPLLSQAELDQLAYADDDRVVGSRAAEWQSLLLGQNLDPWRICWGCNFSMPTAVARHIGGFDEAFVGWGGEDEDMAHRLFRLGVKFLPLPDCYVYHLDHHKRTQQSAVGTYYERMNGPVVRNGGPLPFSGLSNG